MRILYEDQTEQIYQYRSHLYFISLNKEKQKISLPISFVYKILLCSKIISRFLRIGVSHVVKFKNFYYIILNKKIYLFKHGKFHILRRISKGRPISVCVDNFGNFFYGDYFSNINRQPVNLYKFSYKKKRWQIVYTFNNIRHIHGVFYDSFSEGLWVTTGDDNSESAIWFSSDGFKNITKVKSGSQKYRAIDLVFQEKNILYGSDSPRRINSLYSFDRKSLQIEKIQDVTGSVFFGRRYKSGIFFATCAEPSIHNKLLKAELWWSRDGKKFSCIWSSHKDILPMKYFQYGLIHLPYGEGKKGVVNFSSQGLQSDEDKIISIDTLEMN